MGDTLVEHELILLSPYRFPGQSSLILANEDMAAWLGAHSALWHPAVLWHAKGPPRVEAQYDHETPRGATIYAVPEAPPLYLPDDWEERVRAAGSVSFRAGPDRAASVENLRLALAAADGIGWLGAFDLDSKQLAPFFGIGYGHLLLATLAEAMEHENLLDAAGFWDDVQQAIALLAGFPYRRQETGDRSQETGVENHDATSQAPVDAATKLQPSPDYCLLTPDSCPPTPASCLGAAAQKLLSAREVLYPVTIHLLDLALLDENTLGEPWPVGLTLDVPLNVIGSGQVLEKLAADHPKKLAALRARIEADGAEVCGGEYVERADPLLPLDSQLWNLNKGLAVARGLLRSEISVFARQRFGFHPQLPLLLTTSGLRRALYLSFDETSGLPQYSSCVVALTSPDGKQVDAFCRAPYAADNPATFFNLAHHWHKTIREDHAATLVLLHTGQPDPPWYVDVMELARLGGVFGTWTTFARYFNEVTAGEHPPAPTADDFHSDFLSERINSHAPRPVSAFATHLRLRRRVDACWTFAALHRALSAGQDSTPLAELRALEDQLETEFGAAPPQLEQWESKLAAALANRLQARAANDHPGTLLLNPCAFTRRVALELEGGARPIPVDGPVKACQLDGGTLRAVVEIPALGFAWIPREGPAGTQPMVARMRLADPAHHMIRNEFFEAEVDAATGGLKAIRDHKTRVNRLGQRLVFNPGSRMLARYVKVTHTGPALGEIVSEGDLLGEQNQVLATFKQRLRLWLGRPMLEMRIELHPAQPPAGYPWHAYFGSRFAWRDERAVLTRGVTGSGFVTSHARPQTSEYLELRYGRQSTVIFPGGLPFHQRQEGRMLDIILQPEGEEATTFDLGIALDRDIPMQTALGWTSPVAVLPTDKGPPHVGASGWLFHLDAPNLLLTRLTPGPLENRTDLASQDSVTARILECAGHSGHAELRCVRDPQRAVILDAAGNFLLEASPVGDAVLLEVTPNDLVHVQVEFNRRADSVGGGP